MLARLQEILLRDKLHRRLISLLGPPDDSSESYLDDVGCLVDMYREKLSAMAPAEAVAELSANINSANNGDGVDIPLPALEQLYTMLATYAGADLPRAVEAGAVALIAGSAAEQEDGHSNDALAAEPSLVQTVSPEEKFRLAQLVRAGVLDEAVLVNTHVDTTTTQIELNDVEPQFLRGLVRRKFINYRTPLPSQAFLNANPTQRAAMAAKRQGFQQDDDEKETNSLVIAARRQEQLNKDRGAIKARARRQQREALERSAADEAYFPQSLTAPPNLHSVDMDEPVTEQPAVLPAARLPPWMKHSLGGDKSFGPRPMAGAMAEQRRSLPIYAFRAAIVQHVRENAVTVLVGETGSGKTTQIPQYLREEGFAAKLQICCTQPRRVAAESLAARVAEEVGCRCGEEVGYTVRFKDNTSRLTAIKYMTDGMLLREALLDDTFEKYSVIILDEAHERSINTDVLFGVVKKALSKRQSLKVIVTSATLDTEKFCRFFGAEKPFYIKGRTFDVEKQYLTQATDDYVETALQTVMMIHLREPPGDILVFLTGQEEIDSSAERLFAWMEQLKAAAVVPELIILTLYARQVDEAQSKVFEPTPKGQRKVVLATNVAETSITIDGLFYVVDCGFCKQNSYNSKTGVSQLQIVPISRAQAEQRAGRAGRIGPGMCFRLYTEDQYTNDMAAVSIPEIQRSNLTNTVLQLRAVGIADLTNFEFVDPPPKEMLVGALQKLHYLGALDGDGMLTDLGSRMANLPLEPSQSKTLLTAVDLGCPMSVLTIVSMLDAQKKGLFVRPRQLAEEADAKKRAFDHPDGDSLTLLQAYNAWVEHGQSEAWCKENMLRYNVLQEACDTRKQIFELIHRRHPVLDERNEHDSVSIRKALIAGYFFQAAKRTPTNTYVTLSDRREVYLHPSSALIDTPPAAVIYYELQLTNREYMREVTSIDAKWLLELAPTYYTAPKEGRLTREQMAQRLAPILRSWETGSSWRVSRQKKQRK
jgi:ATP-dependent RNA helicase DHX8/PRP22